MSEEAVTPPAETPTPDADTAPPAKDWQAEAEKWKALSRKHEEQSKSNADKARQYDEFTEAQKSELEKALDDAQKAAARAEAAEARELRAEVAADKGVPRNLLSGNTREEMEASADELLAFRGPTTPAPPVDFGGGKRGEDVGSKVSQLTRDDMKRMTPEEIVQAQSDGRFADLLKS